MQKPTYNHLLKLGRLISDAQEVIDYWSKKTKIMLIENFWIETKTKTRLILTNSLLFIVSLKPRPLKKQLGKLSKRLLSY